MKGFRSIPRILKINKVEGFKISCLFSNGESRIIDFEILFKEKFKVNKDDPAFKLMNDLKEFQQVKLIGNSLGWENTGIYLKNEKGNEIFYHYDLDPIVLFENSQLDENRNYLIGKMIRDARKKAGLTQEELAKRSGTKKHYISRLENNKSDIEIQTLKKIIEAGLGRSLIIEIQ